MEKESHRKTRFPAPGETVTRQFSQKSANPKRRTSFPAGMGIQTLSLLGHDESPVRSNRDLSERVQILSRSVKVNPPSATPTRLQPEMTIKTMQQDKTSGLYAKILWEKYKAIRTLERGTEVTAACARTDPSRIVAIKKLSLDQFKKFRNCRHENLLMIMDGYRFEGQIFIVTEYTASTLKFIIAIPLPLEEIHVSATCRQGGPLSCSSLHLLI